MKRMLVAAFAAMFILALAVPAFAYTLNPDTGTGWVGKGEVQSVFGLNNARMQAAHEGVVFTFESSARYAQDCEKDVGGVKNEKTIENTFRKNVKINAVVGSDSRKTGQWTGWFLTGYGEESSDAIPTDLCTPGIGQGEDNNGWTPVGDVYLVEGSESGGLYATIDGVSKLIP